MNRFTRLALIASVLAAACGGDEATSQSFNMEIHGPNDGPDSSTIGFPTAVDSCVGSLRFSSYQGTTLIAQTELAWNTPMPAALPRLGFGAETWIAVEGLSSANCEIDGEFVDEGTVVASGATPRFTAEQGGLLPELTLVLTGRPNRFQRAFRYGAGNDQVEMSRPLLYELDGEDRAGHTVTELEDGSGWLVIGGAKMTTLGDGVSGSGITSLVDSIEFYDAFRGEFLTLFEDGCSESVSACALRLPEGVAFHTSTSLPDGRVLVLGGLKLSGGDALLPTPNAYVIEITGRAEGTVTPVNYASDVFPAARAFHTATRMADGRVVFIGGIGRTYAPEPTYQADIYQVVPVGDLMITDSGANLNNVRGLHTATFFSRNAHGIMVVGGRDVSGAVGTSEVVYAVSNDFAQPLAVDEITAENSTSRLAVPRFGHSATRYSCPGTDEEFLAIVGGFTTAGGTFLQGGAPTATVEVYRPDDFANNDLYGWAAETSQLVNGGRAYGAAVSLPVSGDLVFMGGITGDGSTSSAGDRIFNQSWSDCHVLEMPRSTENTMGTARAFFALAELSTGFLMPTGGFDGTASVETSEFFNPNEYGLVAEYLQ
ncbi:MAG: hypothetical protein ACJAYU_004805 [Bradymonadia bacterium]|jgi:hypothetical protein